MKNWENLSSQAVFRSSSSFSLISLWQRFCQALSIALILCDMSRLCDVSPSPPILWCLHFFTCCPRTSHSSDNTVHKFHPLSISVTFPEIFPTVPKYSILSFLLKWPKNFIYPIIIISISSLLVSALLNTNQISAACRRSYNALIIVQLSHPYINVALILCPDATAY